MMAHFVFNLSKEDSKEVAARLRAKMWGIDRSERHRGAHAPGDLALDYLSAPLAVFIGRAERADGRGHAADRAL